MAFAAFAAAHFAWLREQLRYVLRRAAIATRFFAPLVGAHFAYAERTALRI
ncbi:hypothetical protein [Bifidobacterium crudilactis]|jgi:hypothetical protein|uniref:hypothetical protein n=1 Tax=Bifidobacterium crudilactis TaxID=327277 RepID=UPI002357330C|nr:hypothetical protein [Bifidobacterium crudilactis]MCI1218248.1 hypothetical protein [Bifidobacterium crudilactis]